MLPAAERARLAERLIASLEPDPEIEAAWAVEVRRRLEEWDAGLVEEIPWDEARAEIANRLDAGARVTGLIASGAGKRLGPYTRLGPPSLPATESYRC